MTVRGSSPIAFDGASGIAAIRSEPGSASISSMMARSASRSFSVKSVGPGQMSQKRRERAVAQHLGQRAEPPADELVTVQHRLKT